MSYTQSQLYVLYPGYDFEENMKEELEAIEEFFESGTHITEIDENCLYVLPRFRALPFGRELTEEIRNLGLNTLNSYSQHRWTADIGAWYPVLRDLTFESWSRVEDIPFEEEGPFIVKGETNSRRQLWKTHCYAASREDVGYTIGNLLQDSLIQHQKIWIRKFEHLRTYYHDVVGMPVSEEYRIFYLDGKELARGFYWGNHAEAIKERGMSFDPNRIPQKLVEEIGRRIEPYARFVAVDVAVTENGEWRVVEVNDGQMAGCCGVNPHDLYSALFERFKWS